MAPMSVFKFALFRSSLRVSLNRVKSARDVAAARVHMLWREFENDPTRFRPPQVYHRAVVELNALEEELRELEVQIDRYQKK